MITVLILVVANIGRALAYRRYETIEWRLKKLQENRSVNVIHLLIDFEEYR